VTARPRKAAAVAKPDFATLLAAAKLPERTVQLCLRGDLVADHEAAERDLEQAQKAPSDSLAGSGAGDLADRLRALEAEMRANSYTFKVRALPKPRYRAFLADHPSRIEDDKVNQQDAVFGFNIEAGFEPLIRACLIDPELDDAGWSRLMESLTDRQFDDLAMAAWYVNRGEVDIPFSRAASLSKRASDGE
jgi:hypothetical protein